MEKNYPILGRLLISLGVLGLGGYSFADLPPNEISEADSRLLTEPKVIAPPERPLEESDLKSIQDLIEQLESNSFPRRAASTRSLAELVRGNYSIFRDLQERAESLRSDPERRNTRAVIDQILEQTAPQAPRFTWDFAEYRLAAAVRASEEVLDLQTIGRRIFHASAEPVMLRYRSLASELQRRTEEIWKAESEVFEKGVDREMELKTLYNDRDTCMGLLKDVLIELTRSLKMDLKKVDERKFKNVDNSPAREFTGMVVLTLNDGAKSYEVYGWHTGSLGLSSERPVPVKPVDVLPSGTAYPNGVVVGQESNPMLAKVSLEFAPRDRNYRMRLQLDPANWAVVEAIETTGAYLESEFPQTDLMFFHSEISDRARNLVERVPF